MKLTEQQLAAMAKQTPKFIALQDPDVQAQVKAYKRAPVAAPTPVPSVTRPPARYAAPRPYRPLPAPRRPVLRGPIKAKASLTTQLAAGVLVLLALGVLVQVLVAFAPVVPYILGFLFIMGLGIHSKGGRHR